MPRIREGKYILQQLSFLSVMRIFEAILGRFEIEGGSLCLME